MRTGRSWDHRHKDWPTGTSYVNYNHPTGSFLADDMVLPVVDALGAYYNDTEPYARPDTWQCNYCGTSHWVENRELQCKKCGGPREV